MACILFWSSAVRVHDSQAYRKMDVTTDKGAHQLYLGAKRNASVIQNWIQPCQCCCCLCYILEGISGLEPSSVITEPRYLKLVTVSGFYPFTLISVLMPMVLFVISLVFLALISMLVILPLLRSHECHQQSGDWWLFFFQYWQCLRDLQRHLSWSFPEIHWRGWVRVDIPVGLQLLFRTRILCFCWRGLH